MKAKVRLYKTDGEKERGFPIKIILSHERKTRRKTISYARVYDWNEDRHLPRPSHPDYEELYDMVSEIGKKGDRMEFENITDFEKAFLYLIPEEKKVSDFLEFGEQRAIFMEKKGQKGNARAYRIALNELRKYRNPVYFSDITDSFLEQFKQYKLGEGLKNTSVRGYLYALQAIYKAAVKQGSAKDLNPFEGLYKDIKVLKRRARNAYLEKEEIEKLEQAVFTQKNYSLARDLVLLQFYLGGLDFVDLCYLKREQLQKGRAFVKRHKLGEKAYEFDIMVPEKAQLLIDRHSGKSNVYVFDFAKSETGYATFRVRMYRCLQQIKKKIGLETSPKDSTFTLKIMRHTFATLGKFARVEEDLLRELMGHERNEIDTVYKDKYPEVERDAAQRLIIGDCE